MVQSIDKQAGKLSYTWFAVSGMPSDRVGSSRGGGWDTNTTDVIYCVIWLLLSGPYTYSPYVYATVTRTHGRKNARDALMHACPSTRRNTHGHAKCSTYTCMHTYTQSGWSSDCINTGKYIYWAQWAYYEVHWPYFYKYIVTDSVFISFEIKPY